MYNVSKYLFPRKYFEWGVNMIKNDYMKEIETTLKIIREEIDKSMLDGKTDVVFNMINKEVKALVGLEISTINTLAFSDVVDLLKKENQYNSERYIALAELLYFQGYIYGRLNDNMNNIKYYKKSLESFYHAYIEEEDMDEKYIRDAMEVVEFLCQYEMNIDDNSRIFKFFEINNQFDKAEDTLFYMIKISNKDQSIISKGIEFYNRLKDKDQKVLEEGNLPLEEVEDGLENLRLMLK